MIWARKGVVHVLAFLLLVSLIGGALAVSVNSALSKPAKLEGWLKDSKLYDHFVVNAITQAQKSASKGTDTNGTLLNDPAVGQAAQSAFPPQLLQQSVNTFLDSNYAWLQGKTNKPDFVIDLTSARQSFAQQVGKHAETRFSSLPPCTALQLAQLVQTPAPTNIDALTISCRPPGVSPTAAGALVTKKIVTSDGFLSKPVLTAQTINPKDDKGGSQPYYVKLAKAPQAYRLGQKLPLILGVLALLCTLGIVVIAPARRKGVRRVGWMLLVAGLILVSLTLVVSVVFKRVEQRVFNNSSVGPLQQSLVDFAHRVQHQIASFDLYFAIAYLILAIMILGYIFRTRRQANKPNPPDHTDKDQPAEPPKIQLAPRPRPPVLDVMAPQPKPSGPPPLETQPRQNPKTTAEKPPRRPRLIQ